MTWFAIDDGFDTHPKIHQAGNAAAGLFVRLGAYCARHLTDGQVTAAAIRDYGTPATVRKLVEAGLLHPTGHTCPRCPQPATGGYVLHDFLVYNQSRAKVEAARESGRKRQQKGREATRGQRVSPETGAKLAADSRENEAERDVVSPQTDPLFSEETAGQQGSSHRDTLQGGTGVPSQPIPSPLLPTEEELASPRASEPGPARPNGQGGPAIPDFAAPLVAKMLDAGMLVTWRLTEPEWFTLHALIKRVGTDALVGYAARRWNRNDPPSTARYLLKVWADLPAVPAGTPTAPIGAVAGHQPFQPPTPEAYANDLGF